MDATSQLSPWPCGLTQPVSDGRVLAFPRLPPQRQSPGAREEKRVGSEGGSVLFSPTSGLLSPTSYIFPQAFQLPLPCLLSNSAQRQHLLSVLQSQQQAFH